MPYIAIGSIKVQHPTERRIVIKQPGEKVPQADNWKNVDSYIRRGLLAEEGSKAANDAIKRLAESRNAKAEKKPEPEPVIAEEVAEVPVESEAVFTIVELKAMKKDELQAIAVEMEIDPEQTKAELVADILAAQEA